MSLAPDAGMQQLAADLSRRTGQAAATAAGAGDDSENSGLELDMAARLAIALGNNTDEMRRARQAAEIPWEVCHPAPLNPVSNTAAGTISDERWEPRKGWAWQVVRVSVQSQASGGATSVLLVRDSADAAGAYNMQQFPPVGVTGIAAGSFLGCWEPKGLFFLPGQRIVALTTGGGAVINGDVIEIDLDWLARYLM